MEHAVPATRSRSENWRQSLEQIHERNGSLEITLPRYVDGTSDPNDSGAGQNVIWRVRILSITDDEIQVEEPMALGQTIRIENGIDLVAIIAIGQNRWMFRTKNLGRASVQLNGRVRVGALRLAAPVEVERCQRRNFYRMSTAELSLPRVECWPLINPTSVVAAEVANRAWIMDLINGMSPDRLEDESLILPEVGPKFQANLMNLGGGGVGLMINRTEASAAERARLFWLRIDLTPSIPAPIAMTARLAHTHIDSSQNLYAGFAFEWSFNAGHRDFVVDQITRYVGDLQRRQSAKAA